MEHKKHNSLLFGPTNIRRIAIAFAVIFVCLSVASDAKKAQAYALSEDFDNSAGSISNTVFTTSGGSPSLSTSNCDTPAYCLTGTYYVTKTTASSTAGQVVFYFRRSAATGNTQRVSVEGTSVGFLHDSTGDIYLQTSASSTLVLDTLDITNATYYPVIMSWRKKEGASIMQMQMCVSATCTNWQDHSLTYFDELNIQGFGTLARVDSIAYTSSNTDNQVGDRYSIITSPADYAQTYYSFDIDGQIDIPDATAPTISYAITFTSQTGVDYSALNIYATTSDSDEYTFSHPVTFPIDDIVYARVYVYDNDSWNAVGIVSISEEYEWWVSSSGDVLSTVDLGTTRTGTQNYCQQNFTASSSAFSVGGVRYALCETLFFFFIPSQNVLNNYIVLASTTANKYPFAYFDDVFDVWDSATSSYATGTSVSTLDFNMASSSIPFTATIYRQDMLESVNNDWTIIRYIIGAAFWVFLLVHILSVMIRMTTPSAEIS